MMRRVEDVLDCWFESGSMPFAQVHYPFENADWFEGHFPADFIVEYVGQTRGWFYTLHVLASALFGRPAVQELHGARGRARRRQAKALQAPAQLPRPRRDVQRLRGRRHALVPAVFAGHARRGPRRRERKGPGEAVRSVLNPLWNAWKFFATVRQRGWLPGQVAQRCDRCPRPLHLGQGSACWSMKSTDAMDTYDLYGACVAITAFLDALNNWYIRRSRDRFWSRVGASSASDESKTAAYDTLYTVLHTLCLVSAPLLPMVTETVYRGLTGERSVHLADWPSPSTLPARRRAGSATWTPCGPCARPATRYEKPATFVPACRSPGCSWRGRGAVSLEPYEDLIADELNVKEVRLSDEVSEVADLVLKVNPSVLGPRLGPATQQVISGCARGRMGAHP